ncbi:hypothetical protein DFH09DRAFT_1322730 [Mycena vulgaris]|nr:hypothetical protein DFH09DRAFT_1322730 [Mycena vulgaris]
MAPPASSQTAGGPPYVWEPPNTYLGELVHRLSADVERLSALDPGIGDTNEGMLVHLASLLRASSLH